MPAKKMTSDHLRHVRRSTGPGGWSRPSAWRALALSPKQLRGVGPLVGVGADELVLEGAAGLLQVFPAQSSSMGKPISPRILTRMSVWLCPETGLTLEGRLPCRASLTARRCG